MRLTEIDTMKDLIEKVKAGTLGEDDAATVDASVWDWLWAAYNGDLTSSKALHDAALTIDMTNAGTGWSVSMHIDYDQDHVDGPEYKCTIGDGNYHCSSMVSEDGYSKHSLARAWLMAILCAAVATRDAEFREREW